MRKGSAVISMVIAFGFISISLASANGQTEPSGASSTPITVEAWNTMDPASSQDAVRIEELYKKYEQLHPNVTIKHTIYIYADLRQKAIVAAQAKQGPDLLHMLGEWVPDFQRLGMITDLTSQVKAWSDYGDFPDSAWNVATIDNKIYGIPSIASTRVLLYRGDLFDKYGISVPKTWSDLRDAAKKLTLDTNGSGKPNIFGIAFCSASQEVRGLQEFAVLLWSTGGDLARYENGKWVPGFTVAQAEDVFNFYNDVLNVDHSAPPFSVGWDSQNLDSSMQAGTVAMEQNGAWMRRRALQADTGKSWRTAPFPYDKQPATYLEVKVEGISAYSQHQATALDLLKFLTSRDNLVYWTESDNLPARSDAAQSPNWVSDPVWRDTFVNTVKDGHAMPKVPFGPELKIETDALQSVMYQKMTPAQGAQSFYDNMKSFLASVPQ